MRSMWGHKIARLEKLIHLVLDAAASSAGSFFRQGGNSFGATATLGTNDANNLNVRTNSITRAVVDQAGNITPPTDATGQLGTAALRWNLVRAVTVTTGDLVMLDDEGNAHMTLKESAEHLYLHNAKTGKTFRLLMEEVVPPDEGFAKQPHGSVAREIVPKLLARLHALKEEALETAAAHATESDEGLADARLHSLDLIAEEAFGIVGELHDHQAVTDEAVALRDEIGKIAMEAIESARRERSTEPPPKTPEESVDDEGDEA